MKTLDEVEHQYKKLKLILIFLFIIEITLDIISTVITLTDKINNEQHMKLYYIISTVLHFIFIIGCLIIINLNRANLIKIFYIMYIVLVLVQSIIAIMTYFAGKNNSEHPSNKINIWLLILNISLFLNKIIVLIFYYFLIRCLTTLQLRFNNEVITNLDNNNYTFHTDLTSSFQDKSTTCYRKSFTNTDIKCDISSYNIDNLNNQKNQVTQYFVNNDLHNVEDQDNNVYTLGFNMIAEKTSVDSKKFYTPYQKPLS